MANINFTKMHGLGNDFIIVEDIDLPDGVNYNELAIRLCDRHFGIGADGLIIVNPDTGIKGTDTVWRILNSDGTEPEMCGNGIRCFAKYVHDNCLVDKRSFSVTTLAGVIKPTIEINGMVTVDMGQPILKPADIPVKLDGEFVIKRPLKVLDKQFNINCVSMGNPHCVIFTDEVIDVAKYGPVIETHNIFPEKTNVEFVKVLTKKHIKVDVWERGCGITLACGTGACACVTAGVYNDLIETKATVSLPGGDLVINFDKESNHIFMTGPAEYSFKGVFAL